MKPKQIIGLMLLMGSMTATAQQLALTSGRANSRSGIKTSSDASLSLVAFPGAQGWGRFATGGRTGSVYHVTNLNDKGTGSFRSAVSGSSKKIIVFDVGGVIPLSSDINIGANTTICGQTAPYPGITVRYYTIRPGANNIIRFIRFRRGEEKDVTTVPMLSGSATRRTSFWTTARSRGL